MYSTKQTKEETVIQGYLQLKKRSEALRRAADKASGALEQLMTRLAVDYHCKTVQEANDLLDSICMEQQEAIREFNLSLIDFKEQADVIEELQDELE